MGLSLASVVVAVLVGVMGEGGDLGDEPGLVGVLKLAPTPDGGLFGDAGGNICRIPSWRFVLFDSELPVRRCLL